MFAVELRDNKMVPFGAEIILYQVNGSIAYNLTGDWCSGVGSGNLNHCDIQAVGSYAYAGIGCSAQLLGE